jgi:hypothetical protein
MREEEIEIKIGDVLISDNFEGYMYTGYVKSLNNRTQQRGLFPSYKTREKLRIVDFPIFDP